MRTGIDIYSLNLDDTRAPSWAAIKQGGFDFVMIKVSEWREDDGVVLTSTGAVDHAKTPDHLQYGFQPRWPALKANGLLRGGFHLPRPKTDTDYVAMDAQMATFFAQLPRLVPGDFGPVLDMEDRKLFNDANPARNAVFWVPAIQRLADQAETFYGRQAIIYTQRSWWVGYTNNAMGFDQYVLWVVDINHTTAPLMPSAWSQWGFWQYHWEESATPMPAPFRNPTDKGVDLDHFNGEMYELRGLADIGRPGVAWVAGTALMAHSELDDHLHLLSNNGSAWIDDDLGAGALPGGGADPVLLESGGTVFMTFRNATAIIEAKLTATNTWETTDLTQISQGAAVSDPRAVIDTDKRHVAYWSDDDDWHLLSFDGSWISASLLRSNNLGTATGQPCVFVRDNLPHVVGRVDADGHLFEIWPNLAGGWNSEDVTALARAVNPAFPAATYSPTVYSTGTTYAVAFRAVGGTIWNIDRSTNASTEMTALAGAVRGMGHPTSFVVNDIAHVVYRGIDGMIYDLFSDAGGGWSVQQVCRDKMAADPVAAGDGSQGAVAIRAPDGMIHLAVFDGGSWTCNPTAASTSALPPSPPLDADPNANTG